MGINVIAEGMETQQQLNTLEEMNCEIFQVFFFSPSSAKSSFVDFLASHASSIA
jgi:EAL domain-containing protein (putative c-di-GMP-specific phosphodiesterase class I)